VLVEIKDQIEKNDWPSTDTIWIITSANKEDVRVWLGERFQPHDLLIGFNEKIRRDEIQLPIGMNAFGVWWD
jgi:hypothetical protein